MKYNKIFETYKLNEAKVDNILDLEKQLSKVFDKVEIEVWKEGFFWGLHKPGMEPGYIVLTFPSDKYVVLCYGKSDWGEGRTGVLFFNGNRHQGYEFGQDMKSIQTIINDNKKKLKLK